MAGDPEIHLDPGDSVLFVLNLQRLSNDVEKLKKLLVLLI